MRYLCAEAGGIAQEKFLFFNTLKRQELQPCGDRVCVYFAIQNHVLSLVELERLQDIFHILNIFVVHAG